MSETRLEVVAEPVATQLKQIVNIRAFTQDQRIAFSNRIDAVERGDSSLSLSHVKNLEVWRDRFAVMEAYANADIKRITEDMEIVSRMTKVVGIGPILSAQLVAQIDITKAETVSALWRYCGYGVTEEGNAERRTKGERIHYNPIVKTLCWNIAVSFLRKSSPYRVLYDSAKEKYTREKPDWTPMHVHNASLRIMMKRFLSHFWVVYREIENLPVRVPYVHEKLGHTTMDSPADYGW